MFIDMIYDIFRESRTPGERQMRLAEWFKLSHAGEKNTNEAVYCESRSHNGAHHILVPLDGEWQHNEELVALLLVLAQLWGEFPVFALGQPDRVLKGIQCRLGRVPAV